jgi:hypothetical protein
LLTVRAAPPAGAPRPLLLVALAKQCGISWPNVMVLSLSTSAPRILTTNTPQILPLVRRHGAERFCESRRDREHRQKRAEQYGSSSALGCDREWRVEADHEVLRKG